jgi:hypothetical protein
MSHQIFVILRPDEKDIARASSLAARCSRLGRGLLDPEKYHEDDEAAYKRCTKLLGMPIPHLSPFRQILIQAVITTDIAVSRELLRDGFLEAVEESTRYSVEGSTQDEKDMARRELPLGHDTTLVVADSLEGWAHIYLTRKRGPCDVRMRELMEELNVEMTEDYPILWPLMVDAKRRQYLP